MPGDIQLSDSDGVFLVKTARRAVTGFLSNGNRLKLESEHEKKFSFNSGVFVTLKQLLMDYEAASDFQCLTKSYLTE